MYFPLTWEATPPQGGPRRKTNVPRVYEGWGLTWSHGTRAPPGLERTRAIQKLS